MGDTLGHVVTFYSYKGGVGRTFALADVAVSLARWGYRVLCMDWDIEAPGLDYYFSEWRKAPHDGLLEWIEAYARGEPRPWPSLVETLPLPECGERLHFIGAGNQANVYASRVQSVSWPALYERAFGRHLEHARAEWTRAYDFILIDSRTGLSDVGGVCTIQLPDTLVALFTPNQQSLDGALRVAKSAAAAQKKQPIDRAQMRVVPVVTRVEMNEYEQYRAWMARVAEASAPFIRAWGDEEDEPVDAHTIMQRLAVPQVLYWSYGERLAALIDEPNDPRSVRYAHDTLAALLGREFERVGDLLTQRDAYVASSARGATEPHAIPPVGRLSSAQLKNLHRALISAFPSRSALTQFLMFSLDLSEEDVAIGDSLADSAFNLLFWARSSGRLDDLIQAAVQQNPTNADLQHFVASLSRRGDDS
jgi:cellulose biosynthesis protein BcsQ